MSNASRKSFTDNIFLFFLSCNRVVVKRFKLWMWGVFLKIFMLVFELKNERESSERILLLVSSLFHFLMMEVLSFKLWSFLNAAWPSGNFFLYQKTISMLSYKCHYQGKHCIVQSVTSNYWLRFYPFVRLRLKLPQHILYVLTRFYMWGLLVSDELLVRGEFCLSPR